MVASRASGVDSLNHAKQPQSIGHEARPQTRCSVHTHKNLQRDCLGQHISQQHRADNATTAHLWRRKKPWFTSKPCFSVGTKDILTRSTYPQRDPIARVSTKFVFEPRAKGLLRVHFLCLLLHLDALYALIGIVRVPDVTACSNLTHRRASLIATLEVQRYKRGYDFYHRCVNLGVYMKPVCTNSSKN